MTWVYVVTAGAAGTAARYGIGLALGPRGFPLGTLTVNVVGSFLIGLVLTLGVQERLSQQTTTALAVGFLGAFTTYSTFAWDAVALGRADRLALAALYVGISVTLGLLAAAAGYQCGRLLR
jgi:CrcB protein